MLVGDIEPDSERTPCARPGAQHSSQNGLQLSELAIAKAAKCDERGTIESRAIAETLRGVGSWLASWVGRPPSLVERAHGGDAYKEAMAAADVVLGGGRD